MSYCKSEAQDLSRKTLVGKWKLNLVESGFFPDKDLLFERTSGNLTDYIFEFKTDGTVLHINDDAVFKCPVGIFTMKDGNWKYENNLLTLELRGQKIADYWYWWIIKYRLEKQGDGKIWLRVDEITKNKQLSATATWEELINEK